LYHAEVIIKGCLNFLGMKY